MRSSFFDARHSLEAFWKLLRLDSLLIIAFDIMFFVLVYLSIGIYQHFIARFAQPLEGIVAFLEMTEGQIMPAHETILQAQSAVMQEFIIQFLALSALLAICIVASWTLSRGLIWARIMKKRINIRYFGRLFLLNLLLLAIFSIIAIVLAAPLKLPKVAFWLLNHPLCVYTLLLVLILALVYFVMIIYCIFTEKGKIFLSLREALKTGTTKARHFILPLIAIALFLTALFFLSLLTKIRPISSVLLLVFSVWGRHAFALTVKGLKI